MMLKLLLIIAITVYILSKVGAVIFRLGHFVRPPQEHRRSHPDGTVTIDGLSQKSKKGTSFKGGEYVDFEEVK